VAVSELTDKIRSRGFWEVVIRPSAYQEGRVPYADLDEIVEAAVVRLRGWPVPYIDPREQPIRADNWVGQDVDALAVGHYEAWRFYTSGQFLHLRAVGADWRHEARIAPAPEPEENVIEVWEILFYLTEVFELAARLALSAAGDDTMLVEVGLHGLAGRGLIVGQQNRAPFFEPRRTNQNDLEQRVAAAREDLVARPSDYAVDVAREFFVRFGWKPARDQLVEHQRELTDRA
jgi:hypothetical protein